MNRFLCCLVLGLSLLLTAAAGSYDKWQTHFAYSSSKQVVETPNRVFVISNRYLFSIDKESGEITTYSKVNGLSNSDVSYIAYSDEVGVLLIGYTDAQIDLMDASGNLYPIPDLANKNMAVDKTFFQVYFEKEFAYISTGFGVMAVNLVKHEIADTYILGEGATMAPVYGVTADDSCFYALTDYCIKRAYKKTNLLDYQNWSCWTYLPEGSSKCRDLCSFEDTLYLCERQGAVYRLREDGWETLYTQEGSENVQLKVTPGHLYLSMGENGGYRYDRGGQVSRLDRLVTDMVYVDERKETYLAVNDMAVVVVPDNGADRYYQPQGPYNSTAQSLSCSNGRLWLSSGGSWTDRLFIPSVISHYENGRWTNMSAAMLETAGFVEGWQDVVSIAADPKDPEHFYFATWGEGIFEVKDGKAVQWYMNETTGGAIDAVVSGNHYTRVDGLVFDAKGNLWFSNSGASNPGGALLETRGLGVRLASGEWFKTDYLRNYDLLRQVLVTSRNQKWVVSVRKKPGVFVLDDGGTLQDASDDRTRFFDTFTDQDGNVISPSMVYAIAEDRNGAIWVGTDYGPVVLNSPKNVFDASYHASRIKIAREDGSGLADYLLDGVSVHSLAIDGGNRKWVGTESSGVYLLSADGTTTIQHFTKDNSPLSSNQINAIAINGETGEVFFATEDGVLSYFSDATEPVRRYDKSLVKVYPSPVRPDYSGEVTIVGLEENSLVKIIDASGHLVFEGHSNGGSLVWNLRNRSGQPVSSGAYFVLCANDDEDDNRSIVTKFMVLR
ncbi:MAG: hypothetical protein J6Y77_07600 [Paludibacteraceae bacterium]|nr:hypothetical protein [Paludibacteraceae bacterium]